MSTGAYVDRRTELAAASVDAGYADQAHLTREVRALSGLTPARLLAERANVSPPSTYAGDRVMDCQLNSPQSPGS
jgi:AraC-like DNA-binding protein